MVSMAYTGNTCSHVFTRKVSTVDYRMVVCKACNQMLDYVVTGKRYMEMLSPKRRKEWQSTIDELRRCRKVL